MGKSAMPPVEPGERWVDVPGYEGLYLVSDLGRIWSLHWGGRFLKPVMRGLLPLYPRKSVTLCKDGSRHIVAVHQVVMLAFGPPQPPGEEIRHKNGDGLDCRAVNLEWGTHKQNGQDMVDHGHANGPGDGSAHPRAKLTEELVLMLRDEYSGGGVTERVLADRHGVNVSTLHRMLTRQTWDHV